MVERGLAAGAAAVVAAVAGSASCIAATVHACGVAPCNALSWRHVLAGQLASVENQLISLTGTLSSAALANRLLTRALLASDRFTWLAAT